MKESSRSPFHRGGIIDPISQISGRNDKLFYCFTMQEVTLALHVWPVACGTGATKRNELSRMSTMYIM